MEEWRQIELDSVANAGVSFEVSNTGCVRRAGYYDKLMRYHEPRLVSIDIDKRHNLKRTSIRVGYKSKHFSLHKLVATYFVPNPNKFRYVEFLDGDTLNCNASNLVWTDKRKYGGSGGGICKPVRVYTPDLVLIGEFDSGLDAENTIGVDRSSISACCNRIVKKYLGLIWRFVADDEFYKAGMEQSIDIELLKELCMTSEAGTYRCAIRQYDFDGNIIDTYKTVAAIEDKFESMCTGIHECCKRNYAASCGFIWRYVYDDELFSMSQEERVSYIRNILKAVNRSFVRQYDFNGELVHTFSALHEAEKAVGVSRKHLSMVCRRYKDTKTAGGFVWRFEGDDEFFNLSVEDRKFLIDELRVRRFRAIQQYTLDGKFIAEFPSSLQAVKVTGCTRTAILKCCNKWRGCQSVDGFVFRWKGDSQT